MSPRIVRIVIERSLRMKKRFIIFLISAFFSVRASESVERWGIFELELNGPSSGNPFVDVELSVVFTHAASGKTIEANGFYDGEGVFKIRCMPDELGEWAYTTTSNTGELNNQKGSFNCTAPSEGNHGPVSVVDDFHFAYADGKRYYPVGTTLYYWEFERNKETLDWISTTHFNKARFSPFPHSGNKPAMFPFEGSANNWDHARPNPEYWRVVDKAVKDFCDLGIQADFILFHPYDGEVEVNTYGVQEMNDNQRKFYLRYVTARLAAYRNVWWSMANEFDPISKSTSYWEPLAKEVADNDPYGHLHSIHGYSNSHYAGWDNNWVTHICIQSPNVEKITDWRKQYKKPVIDDEMQYEGNINGWGDLSAKEETRRMYVCIIRGGYGTHGEAFYPYAHHWKGGTPQGTSWERISWLGKEIFQNEQKFLPTGYTNISDVCAMAGENHYLYFYSGATSGKTYSLDKGKAYKVDVIDTWGMKVTEKGEFSDTFTIEWPEKQFMAVRIYYNGPDLKLSSLKSTISIGGNTRITAEMLEGLSGTVIWSVSEGGTLSEETDSGAVFTSGTAGTYTVTAKVGEIFGELTIRVIDPSNINIKVNAGGDAFDDWESAENYIEGYNSSNNFDFEVDPDLTGINSAGPVSIYATLYHTSGGSHTYSFDIPDGEYRVRLHIFDVYDGEVAREMEFIMEGDSKLKDYDTPRNQAVVKDYNVIVSDGNGLQVECKSHGTDVFVSGIEVKVIQTIDVRQTGLSKGVDEIGITKLAGGLYRINVPLRNRLYKAEIVQLNGTVVKNLTEESGNGFLWDTGEAAAGVYIINISGERVFRRKILVAR